MLLLRRVTHPLLPPPCSRRSANPRLAAGLLQALFDRSPTFDVLSSCTISHKLVPANKLNLG